MIIQRGPVLSGGLSTLCFSFQQASGGSREAPRKKGLLRIKLLVTHNEM